MAAALAGAAAISFCSNQSRRTNMLSAVSLPSVFGDNASQNLDLTPPNVSFRSQYILSALWNQRLINTRICAEKMCAEKFEEQDSTIPSQSTKWKIWNSRTDLVPYR